jgi:TrmH family RNA methyltransferase
MLWAQEEWKSIQRGVDCYKMDPSDFVEITDTDNPQGIIALCHIPPESTLQDLAGERGILIATDGIQDPGNLGTIIRSASWFGINGILAGHGTVDLYHPKVVRSTAGSTGVLPYRNADLVSELTFLEEHGWQVVLLDGGSGSLDLRAFEPMEKTVLVVGNEGNGLNRQLLQQYRLKVKIPAADAAPAVESLNASIAVSIALYALSKGR